MVDIEKMTDMKKWWIWKNVGYRRNDRYIKIAYMKKMVDMEKWRIWKNDGYEKMTDM